jgi:hypothetical protein
MEELNRRVRNTSVIGKGTRARQDVRIRRQPYEENHDEMRFCPVLDGDGLDTYHGRRTNRQG